jgi:hypothetical protein
MDGRATTHLFSNITLLLVSCLAAATAVCLAEEPAGSLTNLPAPFKAEEFKKHAVYLSSDELAGRAPGSEGAAKAASYIIRHFEEFGLKPVRENATWYQEFPLGAPDRSSGSVTAKNVVAILPGRGKLSREAVVVCAHYDHLGTKSARTPGEDTIYNGADDNASGVATLLLIAQALTSNKASLPPSYRSVLVISFDGEEQGLLGSKYYVDHPLWPLDKTVAVVNFDVVGRLRMGKLFAFDVESNQMLADCVRDTARQRHLVAETRVGGSRRSDQANFLDRNIPGMQFCTGAHSDYHQVTDESSRLNMEGGATIAWIGYQVLLKAMTEPGPLEFQKSDPSYDVSFLLNMVQTIGIVPNVNAQEGRYAQILFVVPNSEAAKAGLQSGDQITAINGLVFNRVEDAIDIFAQLTLEDGLRLSILRGDVKKQLTIPGTVFQAMSGPKTKKLENDKYDVEFRFEAPDDAKSVYVAGEFNKWNPTTLPMSGPDSKHVFSLHMQLREGSYEYKFVVNGKDWTPDPKNLYRIGTNNNSLLWVGPRHK